MHCSQDTQQQEINPASESEEKANSDDDYIFKGEPLRIGVVGLCTPMCTGFWEEKRLAILKS